jgi:hypothetical protein
MSLCHVVQCSFPAQLLVPSGENLLATALSSNILTVATLPEMQCETIEYPGMYARTTTARRNESLSRATTKTRTPNSSTKWLLQFDSGGIFHAVLTKPA